MFKLKSENSDKGLSLNYKMILIMLLISLVPLLIFAYLNINNSKEALENSTFNQLNAIKTIKANQIESFFEERRADINVLAATPIVNQALNDFESIYQNQGINSSSYQTLLKKYNKYFNNYTSKYDYYDLFLINTKGDIIYTAAQENDLGGNLV